MMRKSPRLLYDSTWEGMIPCLPGVDVGNGVSFDILPNEYTTATKFVVTDEDGGPYSYSVRTGKDASWADLDRPNNRVFVMRNERYENTFVAMNKDMKSTWQGPGNNKRFRRK